MVPPLFELSQKDQHLRRSHPLADPGQQEWLCGADSDLIEGRRIVGEQQRVVVAGPPRQAIATDEQLDVVEGELRVARRESGGAIVFVLEQLGLQVEGEKVADLGAALKRQPAGGSALECAPLAIHQGELAARVRTKHLGTIYRKKRDKSRRRGAARCLDAQACELDLELFHQAIEDGLDVAAVIELVRGGVTDVFDGAGDDPGRLDAAQGPGVQEDSVGQSRRYESLELAI